MNNELDKPTFTFDVQLDEEFPVNLRDLHAALESKRKFTDWARRKLIQFVENEEYTSFHKLVKRGKGGTALKEFIVSIHVAKHIAMMEQTDRGRQVRQYFIDVENAYRQQVRIPVVQSSHASVPDLVASQIATFRVKTLTDVDVYERLCNLHARLTRPLVAPRPLYAAVLRNSN